jgi:hypothetical protein
MARRTSFLMAILLAALGLGCGLTAKQKLALATFSHSAATVGEVTASEMKTFREQGIQANTQVLLFKGESPVANLPKLDSLDRGYELKRIQAVTDAAGALAAYGQTLGALAGDTPTADLKKASTDLLHSLGQVPEVKAQVSQSQMDAVGTVIQDVGGFWIEYKRRQAALALVDRFGPAVDRLCDRLIQDFSSGPTQARGWVYLQLQVTQERLEVAAHGHFSTVATYADRKLAMDAYLLTQDLKSHRDEVCGKISEAAAAMKKANAALQQSIHQDTPSPDDLMDLAAKAQALKAAFAILHP